VSTCNFHVAVSWPTQQWATSMCMHSLVTDHNIPASPSNLLGESLTIAGLAAGVPGVARAAAAAEAGQGWRKVCAGAISVGEACGVAGVGAAGVNVCRQHSKQQAGSAGRA
jgi:hypothetical protein